MLHIYEGLTEDDIREFESSSLGSPYFSIERKPFDSEKVASNHEKIAGTPIFDVGEVSWLKANLLENADRYIPGPIDKLNDIFPTELVKDFTVITDEVIEKVKEAIGVTNETSYKLEYLFPLIGFLTEHKGKQVFSASW